jgi:hypothetical protein
MAYDAPFYFLQEDLFPCERLQDIDQLLVREAGRVAEFARSLRGGSTRILIGGPLRGSSGRELTDPGLALPLTTSASGTCTVAANSSTISNIERIFMSISSSFLEDGP